MDGQVSGLGTVHPLLALGSFGTWILPLHVVSCFNVEEEVVVIRNGWTPKKKRRRSSRIEFSFHHVFVFLSSLLIIHLFLFGLIVCVSTNIQVFK